MLAYVDALHEEIVLPDLSTVMDSRTQPFFVSPKTTVRDVAKLMKEHHVTAICVMENNQAANILEATGLTEADVDDAPSFGQSTPKPPPILTSTQNLNWPLVGVLSSALDDWAKEEESRDVIDPEGGWELDTNAAETEEQEDEFKDAVGDEDVLAGELHPVRFFWNCYTVTEPSIRYHKFCAPQSSFPVDLQIFAHVPILHYFHATSSIARET
ncbi:hypothetical protein PISMIDRAFT_19711 [Pisolithus microcarpus 441]|uniref:CBS domain-containing protein n=1 Tax=Pisolithus microcarpus 441 TaxID=765257 RepID=A0A0C9YTK1_9AGAM|nr:hypothetical protein BKA83DRAFT_19711 [Pisolithus microcarpus]KIK11228.1 hypothetical protein PISMIDRAFT_19711 [Pisolithus microcarpus 441]